MPRFSPEVFARLSIKDPLKRKQMHKAVSQLAEEGSVQQFFDPVVGQQEPILGVVGELQFDVLLHRLNDEYGLDVPQLFILNVSFLDENGHGLDGEMLILGLDMAGVCVSAGSACSSGTMAPSHVLSAIGLSGSIAGGSVRFSMGWSTTREEVVEAVERILPVVRRMRSGSRRKSIA